MFVEEINDKKWNYENIATNAESCNSFIDDFKSQVSEEADIPPDSIFINEITGDPFTVKW